MIKGKGPESIDDTLFEFGSAHSSLKEEKRQYSASFKPYETHKYGSQNLGNQQYQNGPSGAYVTGCIGCFPFFPFLPFIIPIGWLSEKYKKK